MCWISGHFGYDPSFQQFDIVILAENTGLNHLVIFGDCEPTYWQRRQDGGKGRRSGGDETWFPLTSWEYQTTRRVAGRRAEPSVSLLTRAAQASASCAIGGKVL